MHASISIRPDTRATAYGPEGTTYATKWVDIVEPGGSTVTLYLPPDDAATIACCGIVIDALEQVRRAAMERLAAKVKAELPEGACPMQHHPFEPADDPEWGTRHDLCAVCFAAPMHHHELHARSPKPPNVVPSGWTETDLAGAWGR